MFLGVTSQNMHTCTARLNKTASFSLPLLCELLSGLLYKISENMKYEIIQRFFTHLCTGSAMVVMYYYRPLSYSKTVRGLVLWDVVLHIWMNCSQCLKGMCSFLSSKTCLLRRNAIYCIPLKYGCGLLQGESILEVTTKASTYLAPLLPRLYIGRV